MQWIKKIAKLNDQVIRIACLPEDQTTVEPTFAINRPDRLKPVRTKRNGRKEQYRTRHFEIDFDQDGKKFSPQNLQVRWKSGEKEYRWKPGQIDRENLGGSFLSLDLWTEDLFADRVRPYNPMKGFDSHICNAYSILPTIQKLLQKEFGDDYQPDDAYTELVHYHLGLPPTKFKRWPRQVIDEAQALRSIPPGFLSRSGMTVVLDDSLLWNNRRGWTKGGERNTAQVLYLIHYGSDYKQGLSQLTALFGKVPRVPHWIMGVWFSCYRRMGEQSYLKLKDDFESRGLPLDVVVVDTDWHRYFWHGFDWNEKLFPEPDRFAKWLRKTGLHAAFNVHPHYIPKNDSRLDEFLQRTGVKKKILDLKTAENRFFAGCHKVDLFDQKQAKVYFDLFHRPIERQGCDLWWVDGGLNDPSGRDATAWLNEMYAAHTNRGPGKDTSLVLSRTCGLGSHRSTLHFTGDTRSQWKVLEQEVIGTPKASNCLLAYVSHDIGGFFPGSNEWKRNQPPDELYVRWVQFGCFSPILRFHSDHGIREPWRFKKSTLQIVRSFLCFRKGLLPYLMRLVDEAHRTGVGICRPMYYEFPDEEEAYCSDRQYMLGDALLVSPAINEEGRVMTWFPPGDWYHAFINRKVTGPVVLEETIPLETAAVYVRGSRRIPYTTDVLTRKPVQSKNRKIFVPGKVPLTEAMGVDQ